MRRQWWWLPFLVLALYVAARMGVFAFSADVALPQTTVRVPNTFASVDHPFHVARAETLWREIGKGHALRWVGQHQGGYPVEFYPLGEAWMEVVLRAMSFGGLSAEGAHTIAVVTIFLLPGFAFVALAREDGWSPAPALLALALHVSLPGGWYDGGYTELVQWGLITNVAGATVALLTLPFLVRFLRSGECWAAALAAALAATAIYSNPRSVVGLLALGCGAWMATILGVDRESPILTLRRLPLVAAIAALLAAPELISLARFGDLYKFVQFSGYSSLADYVSTSVGAVGVPVIFLAVTALGYAMIARDRLATRAVALASVIYVALTLAVTFVPVVSRAASQLEPTRLMPLQRLLTIYLASVAVWAVLRWLAGRISPRWQWISASIVLVAVTTILAIQTRPLAGAPPDPASPAVPAVSLYPVAMSARAEQVDLENAVREADQAAEPGTALLLLGSALSWHQPLWAPLWTNRPLFYDNWLWYWHPFHAGTPSYRPTAGHHYPDPEHTLDREYLARHGIGAVIATGPVRDVALASPLLISLRHGIYDAYLVREPVTTVTFGSTNSTLETRRNEEVEAVASTAAQPVVVRGNWFPRWAATSDGEPVEVTRRADGYMDISGSSPQKQIDLVYGVQTFDWIARGLAAIGGAAIGLLFFEPAMFYGASRRWYPPGSIGGRWSRETASPPGDESSDVSRSGSE